MPTERFLKKHFTEEELLEYERVKDKIFICPYCDRMMNRHNHEECRYELLRVWGRRKHTRLKLKELPGGGLVIPFTAKGDIVKGWRDPLKDVAKHLEKGHHRYPEWRPEQLPAS